MSKSTLYIETTARHLTSALKLAGKVVERRNSIPVLSMVLFEAGRLFATDLDMEISIALPVTQSRGTAALDYSSLFNLVSHLPKDEIVKIEVNDQRATVLFENGKYEIPALPASDFPRLSIGEWTTISIDGDDLKKGMQFIQSFISTEETRYYLNGICLDGKNAVATDGHRLGCYPLKSDFEKAKRVIIPRKVVSIMCGLPAPKTFSISDRPAIRFYFDGITIISKAIDGTFPDWPRVVPAYEPDAIKSVTFDRETVRRAVGRVASVLGSREVQHGCFAFASNKIVLKRNHSEVSGSECISAETASELSLGLNLGYLSALLRAIPSSEKITLLAKDCGSPMKFMVPGRDEYVVLMPARVDDRVTTAALLEAKAGGLA